MDNPALENDDSMDITDIQETKLNMGDVEEKTFTDKGLQDGQPEDVPVATVANGHVLNENHTIDVDETSSPVIRNDVEESINSNNNVSFLL